MTGPGPACAHLSGCDDGITTLSPVLERFSPFAEFIAAEGDSELSAALRRAETIGRPTGDAVFRAALETSAGCTLKPAKRGPKTAD